LFVLTAVLGFAGQEAERSGAGGSTVEEILESRLGLSLDYPFQKLSEGKSIFATVVSSDKLASYGASGFKIGDRVKVTCLGAQGWEIRTLEKNRGVAGKVAIGGLLKSGTDGKDGLDTTNTTTRPGTRYAPAEAPLKKAPPKDDDFDMTNTTTRPGTGFAPANAPPKKAPPKDDDFDMTNTTSRAGTGFAPANAPPKKAPPEDDDFDMTNTTTRPGTRYAPAEAPLKKALPQNDSLDTTTTVKRTDTQYAPIEAPPKKAPPKDDGLDTTNTTTRPGTRYAPAKEGYFMRIYRKKDTSAGAGTISDDKEKKKSEKKIGIMDEEWRKRDRRILPADIRPDMQHKPSGQKKKSTPPRRP